MAAVGVQLKGDLVVVTIGRRGISTDDLLFIPQAHDCVFTSPDDLLWDNSNIVTSVTMVADTALRLAELLINKAEKVLVHDADQ